jgi:hypothetical protein
VQEGTARRSLAGAFESNGSVRQHPDACCRSHSGRAAVSPRGVWFVGIAIVVTLGAMRLVRQLRTALI